MIAVYITISKTLLYHCKGPEKPRVLLLGPTEISAVYTGGTVIHSCLVIKAGTKLLGLNHKSVVALRNRLSEEKLLIIDELSIVSGEWTGIVTRLAEMFVMISEKAFASLPVMTVADLLQLFSAKGKTYTFSIFR